MASQHPVIKECATTVNTLLLAQILAESHGSLHIHVPDWKDFLTTFEAPCAACVCVCANVHFQYLKLTKRIWKEDRTREAVRGKRGFEEMKECLRFSCFVLLFSVIHHLPPRAEPFCVLQSSRQTSTIRLLRIKLGVRFLVSLRFYSRHVRTLLQSVTHPGCRCKHKCAPFMDVVCIIKTICQSLFPSNGEKKTFSLKSASTGKETLSWSKSLLNKLWSIWPACNIFNPVFWMNIVKLKLLFGVFKILTWHTSLPIRNMHTRTSEAGSKFN